jgi:protocatechuate 3,4-dioxygenase beta subunit
VNANVVLARGGVVRGRVEDSEGRPIDAARIVIGASPMAVSQRSARSGPDGAFEIPRVTPGEQTVWCLRAGRATTSATVEVRDERAAELVLAMPPGGVAEGRVVDERGGPVAFARIDWYEQGWAGAYVAPGTYSDPAGRFRTDQLPPLPFHVRVNHQAFAFETLDVDAPDGPPLEIVLTRAGRILGRVVDGATGAAIDAFRIRFVTPRLAAGEELLRQYSSRWSEGQPFVDAGGRWEARGRLAVGAVVGVEVSAPGFTPAIDDHVVVRPLDGTDEVVMALHRGARVTGRVVDAATGLPVEGALVRWFARAEWVELETSHQPAGVPQARTDADGRFELDGVPTGDARLGIAADGYAPHADGPFSIADGTVERAIALTCGGAIAGVLLEAGGTPLAGEEILFGRIGSREDEHIALSRVVTTDADGRFQAETLVPGNWQVTHRVRLANQSAYAIRRLVRVAEGARAEVELRPLGTARVRGTLRAPASTELPPALPVSIHPAQGFEDRAMWMRGCHGTVAVDGAFAVGGLAPGEYTASVYPQGGLTTLRGSVRFTVDAGGIADVILELAER